ncbi:Xaa-Pro aminopeptidase [Alteromonas lipolytica]|uniref:Xaa-Pro aminopeptidase n=1 Tax=Alteromonas lipolytica TaxID=1856405 RepID=A0A1E8FDF1_9ALTE|nr:Xaa-Pro aminopeptidase [Alteromonas lipolytica]OFI33962.1 Xaa-Pro aminopeptidase [Alteromonas lipolytica]GGF66876.1 Xaa-Pro aminopeptidase [Alteromonas lipolytica]
MITAKQYRQRQTRLLQQLPANSVLVVPSARLVTRSRDTEYVFRQHSDFWYLTGFNEPDAWLLLSNHERYAGDYRAMLCQPKDPNMEIWLGKRLGPEQAVATFKLDEAYPIDDLAGVLTEWLEGHEQLFFAQGEFDHADEAVFAALATLRNTPKQNRAPASVVDYRPLVHEMRLIKSRDEIAVMQQAADISARAHCRAMGFVKPGAYEYQLEAELHHEFAMGGARQPAYGTIVGSGANACILHYTENNAQIADGSLILIDAGAELQGYAADITRTFPANGKFSQPQAQLYQLVLDAQEAALAEFKAGVTLPAVTQVVIRVLTSGLCRLGLLSESVEDALENKSWQRFFMHGLGHYLGLDVHDVGDYLKEGQPRPLVAGMVITVEPGLYIPVEDDIPVEYRGIGIRIEDNIVITHDGYDMLTGGVPKTIAAIEALMAKNPG